MGGSKELDFFPLDDLNQHLEIPNGSSPSKMVRKQQKKTENTGIPIVFVTAESMFDYTTVETLKFVW